MPRNLTLPQRLFALLNYVLVFVLVARLLYLCHYRVPKVLPHGPLLLVESTSYQVVFADCIMEQHSCLPDPFDLEIFFS